MKDCAVFGCDHVHEPDCAVKQAAEGKIMRSGTTIMLRCTVNYRKKGDIEDGISTVDSFG